VYYKEIQKFGSIPLYFTMGLIYLSILSVLIYALINHFIMKGDFINGHTDENGLIIISIFIPLVFVIFGYLLFASKLIVEINEKGIKYSFKPLIRKEIFIPKENIKSWEVRKYRPIVEYGGWGVKPSRKRRYWNKRRNKVNNALNVRGNIGLQLTMISGNRLLIGTQRAEAIKRAMKKLIPDLMIM